MWKDQLCTKFGQKKHLGEGLLRVDWVSRVDLSKEREDQIRQCFNYTVVEIHYPDDVDDLNLIIERFQKETHNNAENNNDNCKIFGENKKFDKLIVMDNISGLAEKSSSFTNFLTVSRKFGYICLYIIYPTKSIWQKILTQTKIFNVFPSTIQLGNILKNLISNYDR